ncbi:MAG: PilZ domain-containing protein [Desulfomonile tiedjei]|uniref:PilZ domain-containing protein n=1 Tax=Desulfomonile tiedjei TaxID=2358 RepID=A0A9D6UZX2_9BACT|nr:PilZ domain-containing protein [Desulfomonile tiedjei]
MAPESKINLEIDRIRQMRRTPRGYPIVDLAVFDVDDPTMEGHVLDISEKGIQISGITVKVEQKKTFMVQADQFDNIKPFSFDAECRWFKPATDEEPCAAGFEIINISDKDQEELQKILETLSFYD